MKYSVHLLLVCVVSSAHLTNITGCRLQNTCPSSTCYYMFCSVLCGEVWVWWLQ